MTGQYLHTEWVSCNHPTEGRVWAWLTPLERDAWDNMARHLKPQGTEAYLLDIVKTIRRSGDPDEPFWYLGGPMTGHDKYNIPAFDLAGTALRYTGYNIISPAEIDTPEERLQALEAGAFPISDEEYNSRIRRDLIICSLPTCLGVILLPGWEHSRGVRGGESWVVSFLDRHLYEYSTNIWGDPILTWVNRDERLTDLGFDLTKVGSVPKDQAGDLTVAAKAFLRPDLDGPPIDVMEEAKRLLRFATAANDGERR